VASLREGERRRRRRRRRRGGGGYSELYTREARFLRRRRRRRSLFGISTSEAIANEAGPMRCRVAPSIKPVG
jgi:hypothetical protein